MTFAMADCAWLCSQGLAGRAGGGTSVNLSKGLERMAQALADWNA